MLYEISIFVINLKMVIYFSMNLRSFPLEQQSYIRLAFVPVSHLDLKPSTSDTES